MEVNKVVINTHEGERTLIDLTEDSVSPETLAEGETAHDASGTKIVGTMKVNNGEYIPTPAQATVGQTIVVKAVDENGKPTEWETADMPSGGGVTSWNDLEDKPFGETDDGGDTLTWDGNTEGRVCVDLTGDGNALLVHISDVIPTVEDFANGATISAGTNTINIVGTAVIGDVSAMLGEDGSPYGWVANTDGATSEGMFPTLPKAGVYFPWIQNVSSHPMSLTIPNYTGFPVLKKIDEKYLPEHSHKWGDIEDRPFGDVPAILCEEQTVTFANGVGAVATSGKPAIGDSTTVIFDGVPYTCVAQDVMGFTAIGNVSIFEYGDDTGEPFLGLWMDDTYLEIYYLGDSETAVIRIDGNRVVTLPEKYYTKQRLLYTDGTYIYADGGLSTKLTATEFITLMTSSPLVIVFAGELMAIISGGIEYNEDEVGYCCCYLRGEFVTYYTAEYKPTATAEE